MIGKIISHYRIIEELGRGGMGVVYKAEDTKLKRTVALKFLPTELTRDSEAKERFIREAQAASAIEHPNICNIHEIDETEDGQLFIVMALYEGETLKDKIKDKSLPGSGMKTGLMIKDALDIFVQIAEGLAKAHEKGIVHRDIKPANIFVTKDGLVKILDFGLAKLVGQAQLTKDSSTLGTVAYMSPEQLSGKEIDQRTDIWSLGVVLYEMLTGRLPFEGDYEQSIIYGILNEAPASLAEVSSKFPLKLYQLTDWMLSKEPEARPDNCDLIRQEILKADMTQREETQKENAVVVLPFADMSPHKDQEYFCDGIAEEIINALTHVQDLRIIARTSAFSFKNKNIDVREIGRKLGVDFLLEGSIRKAGNQLRITTQLINVADGSHIWSQRYDRQLIDVFRIQDEIAIEIVEKMKISPGRQERKLITKRYTNNTEAYNLYLKGRYYYNQFNENGYHMGIEYFQKALDLDTSFALAFAGMANCYAFLGWYYYDDPVKAFTRAKETALTALSMDEQLSEAHSALAMVKMAFDREWQEAEKEFQRALMLNPGYSEAHAFYSIYLAARKRHEESIDEAKKGLNLDPVTFFPGVNLGMRYYYARQYDRALQEMENALNLNPHVVIAQLYISFPLILNGLYDEAYQNILKAISQIGREQSELLSTLGIIEVFRGNQDKALEILEELNSLADSRQVSCFFMAILCTKLDKFDEAFLWLEKGFEKHDHLLIFLQVEPLLDQLRSDNKYLVLLKKMGLIE